MRFEHFCVCCILSEFSGIIAGTGLWSISLVFICLIFLMCIDQICDAIRETKAESGEDEQP